MKFSDTTTYLYSGVYCIRNIKNKKLYVGSALSSIRGRFRRHLAALRKGTHNNRYLQNAWNKHGEKSFRFYVLTKCPAGECETEEQRFINRYRSYDRRFGYNVLRYAYSSKGYVHTEEAKEAQRKRRLGKKLSEETKSKIGKFFAGKPLNVDHRNKISNSLKGKTISNDEKLRLRFLRTQQIKNGVKTGRRIGSTHTPETRQRISDSTKGKPKSHITRMRMSQAMSLAWKRRKERMRSCV